MTRTNITQECTGRYKLWVGDEKIMRPISQVTYPNWDAAEEALHEYERENGLPISEWIDIEIRRLREPAPGTEYVTAAGIHALQNHLGLTEVEFGTMFGVYPSTVRRWKRGETRPHKKHLRRLEKMIREMEDAIGEDLEEHFTPEELEQAEEKVKKIFNG